MVIGYYGPDVTTWLIRHPSLVAYHNPSPQTGGWAHKLAAQIAAKRCQTQWWFVLTAYGNVALATKQ